ncbi:hypothetical protein KUV23_14235 [Algoriphagus marincola]|uniref:Secreted protein n=1 Tax=Algoriphagus marincola TaxID=264027 RepID=A0ABS7N725_9BACT|nr:hypothetical protein [Algoriphagus marincola]MBY5952144.1 hypothetical protein [Algoriphagus marincola]
MKKVLSFGIGIGFCISLLNVQISVAACNEGHYSTGNQGFGGPNGRWELVCDQAHSAVCCISHPPKEQ